MIIKWVNVLSEKRVCVRARLRREKESVHESEREREGGGRGRGRKHWEDETLNDA